MLLDRRSGFRRFTAPANPSPKEATDMGEQQARFQTLDGEGGSYLVPRPGSL
jgi:hypothetical protein